MPRPRKSTRQEFYDVFADFPTEDQSIVLEFLAEIHRQALRQAAKRANEPHERAVLLTRAMDADNAETERRVDGLDGAPK